jgi:hypothetical protein
VTTPERTTINELSAATGLAITRLCTITLNGTLHQALPWRNKRRLTPGPRTTAWRALPCTIDLTGTDWAATTRTPAV